MPDIDILISEVGPRDGLQSIAPIMPLAAKCAWITAEAAAGVREIEVGSFVPASLLPQLADTVATQISIEAAQPKLDLGVLRDLSGKTIMLGVLDLGDNTVETPDIVAGRIRAGLKFVAAEKLVPAPDCGMKYLPRDVAFGKLKAMADGAAIVRKELAG